MRSEEEVRAGLAVIDWLYEGGGRGSPAERDIAAMGGILKWVLGDDQGHVQRLMALAQRSTWRRISHRRHHEHGSSRGHRMTTGELKAAAERVAEFTRVAMQGTASQAPAYWDAAYMAVYNGTSHSRLADFRALALHCIGPADDAEPVTAEWLESTGWELHDARPHWRKWRRTVCVVDHGFNIGKSTHWLDIHEPQTGADGSVWWPINFWQQHESDEKPEGVAWLSWVSHTTRGDVRRLLKALAVADLEPIG